MTRVALLLIGALIAQLAPVDRTPRNEDTFPGLEQISLIAVK